MIVEILKNPRPLTIQRGKDFEILILNVNHKPIFPIIYSMECILLKYMLDIYLERRTCGRSLQIKSNYLRLSLWI